MKKILLILLCLPFVGIGQSIPACDSSIAININNQNANEVVYSVSGPNLNMSFDFAWVYFDMLGNCIGGSAYNSPNDTVNLVSNLPDSTEIWCMITDSLGSCIVTDILVYDSLLGWFFTSNNSVSLLTYVPDDNFEDYLETNGMGNGISNDDYVTTSNINTVTYLYINSMNISDLTGIEDFIALEFLQCNDNQITEIDVSNNINLLQLFCYDNQLTSLNVSNNPLLNHLYCFGNLLTSLDVSNTPCSIWSEPAFSGNGGWNTTIDNPNLFCIEVDDVNCWNTNFIWSVDSTYQYFSTNCSATSIQDQTVNKVLLKVTDLLGRETKGTKNEPLLYIYDDGTVEKRIIVE
jgi:hypothetical protein